MVIERFKIRLFLSVVMLSFFLNTMSQSMGGYDSLGEPLVGKMCPNYFIQNIAFYRKKEAYLNEFRGKWLILDFWAKNCSGCIGRFPETNLLQKELRDSIQILMVAPNDPENENEPLYANYHDHLHLEMPSAFDSSLFSNCNVSLLPHVVIIDPRGIVRVITNGVNSKKLHQLLEGKDPAFRSATYRNDKEKENKFRYNSKLPFLVSGNGGADTNFLFRSLLSTWTPSNPYRVDDEFWADYSNLNEPNNQVKFEALGVNLTSLFRAAYIGKTFGISMNDSMYGKVWPTPVLEVKDTSLFEPDYGAGKNLYCYSLVVPSSKAEKWGMMHMMQNDLKSYFAYEVSFELRMMPYWRLIASDSARDKIITKGGPTSSSNNNRPYQEVSFKNMPISDFLRAVEFFAGVHQPILNETNIVDNIDITVDWFKDDLKSVQEALKKNGLDLIPGRKEMKVLVIRDNKLH